MIVFNFSSCCFCLFHSFCILWLSGRGLRVFLGGLPVYYLRKGHGWSSAENTI